MALVIDRHVLLERPLAEGKYVDDELLKKIQDCQSRRLEDQRTPLPLNPQEESFLNLVSNIQGSRLDDQRASLHLTDPSPSSPSPACEKVSRKSGHLDDEEFLDLLYRCQSSRINKQRSMDPRSYWRNLMPGEDFFNLLQHLQSLRIEDQRSPLPLRS